MTIFEQIRQNKGSFKGDLYEVSRKDYDQIIRDYRYDDETRVPTHRFHEYYIKNYGNFFFS